VRWTLVVLVVLQYLDHVAKDYNGAFETVKLVYKILLVSFPAHGV